MNNLSDDRVKHRWVLLRGWVKTLDDPYSYEKPFGVDMKETAWNLDHSVKREMYCDLGDAL